MQWRQIRSALEVARYGSFTRAAESLHISQPALSEQVRLLEDRLGFALFVRTGRGTEVTDKGLTFLHEAGRIANDIAHLQDVARNLLAGGAETIKVGVISGLATVMVQHMFPHGSLANDKQFKIRTASTRVILDELFKGQLDMGFVIATAPGFVPSGLVVRPLFEVALALAVPPGHPLAGSTCQLEQLAGQPLIMNELSVGYGLRVMDLFGQLGIHPRIQAVVDNVETMLALVKAGAGVALVPLTAAANEARLGGVSIVEITPAERITVELYRPRAGMSKFKEDLLQAMIASLQASHMLLPCLPQDLAQGRP